MHVSVYREVDFLNLMSYDIGGVWSGKTAHNAALFARQEEMGTPEEQANVVSHIFNHLLP